jgi:PPOX class probable FMN-dependent enzyme
MATIDSVDQLRARYAEPKERSLRKQLDRLDAHCRRFIELSPLVVLASVDEQGRVDASPRGGDPGFVEVEDDRTLLLPDRPGNNRLDSLANVVERPEVGLLFFLPGMNEMLRVNGEAELRDDPGLLERFTTNDRTPRTVLAVHVREAYLHCAKALMRAHIWDPATQIDRAEMPTLGEMLRDQIGPIERLETQEEMLARYQEEL